MTAEQFEVVQEYLISAFWPMISLWAMIAIAAAVLLAVLIVFLVISRELLTRV